MKPPQHLSYTPSTAVYWPRLHNRTVHKLENDITVHPDTAPIVPACISEIGYSEFCLIFARSVLANTALQRGPKTWALKYEAGNRIQAHIPNIHITFKDLKLADITHIFHLLISGSNTRSFRSRFCFRRSEKQETCHVGSVRWGSVSTWPKRCVLIKNGTMDNAQLMC
jgi:hypothetical protein